MTSSLITGVGLEPGIVIWNTDHKNDINWIPQGIQSNALIISSIIVSACRNDLISRRCGMSFRQCTKSKRLMLRLMFCAQPVEKKLNICALIDFVPLEANHSSFVGIEARSQSFDVLT